MNVVSWSQFGLAGLVTASLSSVIAYIFKLLLANQTDTTERALKERDAAVSDNDRLHNRIEDQQRTTLVTLADVARIMGDVQTMLREREIAARVEHELKGREEWHGTP